MEHSRFWNRMPMFHEYEPQQTSFCLFFRLLWWNMSRHVSFFIFVPADSCSCRLWTFPSWLVLFLFFFERLTNHDFGFTVRLFIFMRWIQLSFETKRSWWKRKQRKNNINFIILVFLLLIKYIGGEPQERRIHLLGHDFISFWILLSYGHLLVPHGCSCSFSKSILWEQPLIEFFYLNLDRHRHLPGVQRINHQPGGINLDNQKEKGNIFPRLETINSVHTSSLGH